jgi:hypothetical protein
LPIVSIRPRLPPRTWRTITISATQDGVLSKIDAMEWNLKQNFEKWQSIHNDSPENRRLQGRVKK